MLVYSVGSQNEDLGTIKLTKNQIGFQLNSIAFGGYKYVNRRIMEIDSSIQHGMVINQYFDNLGSAKISIKNSGINGIYAPDPLFNFKNEATLPMVINKNGSHGIHVLGGIFTNEINSTLTIRDNIINGLYSVNSIFTNNGLLQIEGSGQNNLRLGGTSVFNHNGNLISP